MGIRKMFSGMGAKFNEGINRGLDKPKGEQSDWQREFQTLQHWLQDTSIPDEIVVNGYFKFISDYPEKRILDEVRGLLETIMNVRPNTVEIIQKKINK